MSDIMNIGIRGLLAFQAAMTNSAQNIANVKTPYYSRRQTNFAEDIYGGGINIADVVRIYDDSASKFLRDSNSNLAFSDAFLNQISELESVLGNQIYKDEKGNDRNNNIATFINDSILALRELDGDTKSIQSRTIYLNRLSALSNRFNAISNQIDEQYGNINLSIQTTAGDINKITQQLAQINSQIQGLEGQDASGLLDQREILLQNLAQYINYSTQDNADGTINILINNGTPIVFGSDASTLTPNINPNNPGSLVLDLTSPSSVYSMDVSQLISGGQMGAYFKAQAALHQSQNDLGRLALGLQDQINQQNKLGIDLNGNLGSDVFNDINNSRAILQRSIPNATNGGALNMSVSITDTSQLTTSDYKLVFDTPSHYSLTRLSDNSVVSSGTLASMPAQISVDGISVNINSGSITAGDTYNISPTAGAAGTMAVAIADPKLLALGWPVIAQANINNSGDGTIKVSNIVDTTNTAFSNPGQLNPPLIIHFLSANSYEILNASDSSVIEGPISYSPGADVFPTPGGYDPGYRIQVSGANIQAGDVFNLDYNANGSGDNRNGQALESLYTKNTIQGGTLNFTQAYNLLSSDISIKTNSSTLDFQSYTSVQAAAASRYSSISGVSVPEESTNMLELQQCYQATAQIIQTAKTIFETIIGLGRGS